MAAGVASAVRRLGYAGLGLAAAGAFVDQCLYNGKQSLMQRFLIAFDHAVGCS